jgi:aminoglycoside phosphotransferase (APT) family kinase protein
MVRDETSEGAPTITSALVASLIAQQFPAWANLPVRPVEPQGWDNRTFRVGETLAARLPSAPRYAAQVEKEQRWLPKLAPHLPLAIPEPLAMGQPTHGYPWTWSVYRWLPGESAEGAEALDMVGCAHDLAAFLSALEGIDPADGPAAGQHNFYRGGSLQVYDAETREAAAVVSARGGVDAAAALSVWDAAVDAAWHGRPMWVHGDVSAGNLLVRGRWLAAVIDFGCCGVGDPACDLTIAWTFFRGASRRAFRDALALDDGTWRRARGWALWKALITIAAASEDASGADPRVAGPQRVIDAVFAEHRQRE